MAYSDGTLSPADLAVLSGNSGNNNGWADGSGAWWIILFLIFGAFGNGNGFGWGGNGGGAQENYVLASDFATLQRQIDSATTSLENKGDRIQEQICNTDQMLAGQFANLNTNLLTNAATLNNTLATNFGTTNSNLMNGFANVNQGISANRYENQLAMNTLGSQLQNCCCDQKVLAMQNANALQSQLANMNYDNTVGMNGIQTSLAAGFNGVNQTACMNTRDIIDNNNNNFRQLHDEIVANRMSDKDAQISELQTALNNANLAASQARQTNQIVDQLRAPTPVPAFNVPMPWSYNGYNNGCGCNNF